MNVGVIFGGKSAEHGVSIRSAKNVIEALKENNFNIFPIGVSKKGEWFLFDEVPKKIEENEDKLRVIPGGGNRFLSHDKKDISIDVVFPVLHGPNAEDGTIQGVLRAVDIPFVGPSLSASAAAMDKETAKVILQSKNLPVVDYLSFLNKADISLIEETFNYPVFVKPANMGSSIGISKAENKKQLKAAIAEAFRYDQKILIERSVSGREFECAVLGNNNPKASQVGEVRVNTFYSYDEKYSKKSNAEIVIPANIDKHLEENIQKLSVESFTALGCEGMARVDFLVEKNNIFINEINTIPGFTEISMYPKLWESSGISYPELMRTLLKLAKESYRKRKNLKLFYKENN